MLKLTKYELRKNVLGIGIVAGIICALQILFTFFCLTKKINYTVVFAVLLIVAASVSYFIVFIFGVVSYSKELSSKSSYLIFMTPNSSISIIVSKLFYTLIIGIGIAVVLTGLGVLDGYMMAISFGEYRGILKMYKEVLEALGLNIGQLLINVIGMILSFLVSFFFLITLAYFAITLSSTALQNKKIKGLISVIIFCILAFITIKIASELPEIYTNPVTFAQEIITSLPANIFQLLVAVGCTFGSALLLDKKVSL